MKRLQLKFEAELHRPENPGEDDSWTFCLIPKEVSQMLPRRGRLTVDGNIDGHEFRSCLEPDGQLSHWLKIPKDLQTLISAKVGDTLNFTISTLEEEPDPEVPPDFERAIAAGPDARKTWDSTTNLARLDWIHWIVTAKQVRTREKRIRDACDMLSKGKKRVCCFDPSGYYSKAFKAPKPAGKVC